MGTRHLTAVILNKKVVVAQYGQWDGYPEGQGKVVMNFISKFLNKKLTKGTGLDKFKRALKLCKFLTETEIRQTWTNCGADPASDLVGWDVATKHTEQYPGLSRDTGAKVLELIYKGDVFALHDSWSFGLDSVFCEYAYILDLDNKVLEVYKGFNKTGKVKGRFAKGKSTHKDYAPITLFKKINFKDCGMAAVKQLMKDIEAFYERQEKEKELSA